MPEGDDSNSIGAAAVAAALTNEPGRDVFDMIGFLRSNEDKKYHAIMASILNFYINSSRVVRGNTLMGPDDVMAILAILEWVRAMKPVQGDLATFAGTNYLSRGGEKMTGAPAQQPQRRQ